MKIDYKNARYLHLILHEIQSRNGGDRRKSERQIQAMAGEDQRLLLDLVRPYLNDIVIAAVENINIQWINEVDEYGPNGELLPKEPVFQASLAEEKKSRKVAKSIAAHFSGGGLDKNDIANIIGKMRKNSAAKQANINKEPAIPPPKSSRRQANMMHMLASAYKTQRDDEPDGT